MRHLQHQTRDLLPGLCWDVNRWVQCTEYASWTLSPTPTPTTTTTTTTSNPNSMIGHTEHSSNHANPSFFGEYALSVFAVMLFVYLSLSLVTSLAALVYMTKQRQEQHKPTFPRSNSFDFANSEPMQSSSIKDTKRPANHTIHENHIEHQVQNNSTDSVPLYYECAYIEPQNIELTKLKRWSTPALSSLPPSLLPLPPLQLRPPLPALPPPRMFYNSPTDFDQKRRIIPVTSV